MRRIWMAIVVGSMLAALAPPIAAQDWSEYFDRVGRRADMRLLVYDPDRTIDDPDGTIDPATGGIVQLPRPGYVSLTLAMLLDGLVTFPDTLVHYAGLIEWVDGTPTLTEADFATAIAGAPGSKVIQLPPTPMGASLVRIIFAIPVDADDPDFIAAGAGNSGLNAVGGYAKQVATVMLGTPAVVHNVWYRTSATFPLSFTQYLFLDITAQP